MTDSETKQGQALLAELETELTPSAEPDPTKLEDFLGVEGQAEVPEAQAAVSPATSVGHGLRSARILSLKGRSAQVRLRGAADAEAALIAPEVDARLVELALKNGDHVLVEWEPSGLIVVGVLQVKVPERLEIRAGEVLIEGDRELTLRSGRAAARFRKDGDVELVGSRISAASRGLFRIVGRILRLN